MGFIVETKFNAWGSPEFMEEGPKGQVLIMGGNGMYGKYGYGEDLAAAKKAFRGAGGLLSLGYGVITFGPNTEFYGVDGMGRYWSNCSATEEEPEVTRVEARKKK